MNLYLLRNYFSNFEKYFGHFDKYIESAQYDEAKQLLNQINLVLEQLNKVFPVLFT